MRVVIAYESMFGNTRVIAEAIAKGFHATDDVVVLPVSEVAKEVLHSADLVIVGAPTHAHGMSRESTRKAAGETARKPTSTVVLEPHASGPGVREWLESLDGMSARAAAFDTRIKGPAFVTGSAAARITRQLCKQGVEAHADPTSFFVTKENRLRPGEQDRATRWGRQLAVETMLDRTHSASGS